MLILIGDIVGRLTILEEIMIEKRKYYKCSCSCGKLVTVRKDAVSRGVTKSCGCYHTERTREKGKNKKYNRFIEENGITTILTNKNELILIDTEDYDKVKEYCWSINNCGYPQSRDYSSGRPVLMHSLLFSIKDKQVIDHINHIKTDNRKENLRVCFQKENARNHVISLKNTSGNTGVYWNKQKNRWDAKIGFQGKSIHVGCFKTKEEATTARRQAEIKYFEEYRPKERKQ